LLILADLLRISLPDFTFLEHGMLQRIVRIDAVILELPIERRAPNSKTASDLAHLAAIKAKREPDQLFLNRRDRADPTVSAKAGDRAVG
jgi:hypothetical protein